MIATVQDAELATKIDVAELHTEFKADIAALRAELKADILNRVFSLILGALVVNIMAMIGAVFAVARLVGH